MSKVQYNVLIFTLFRSICCQLEDEDDLEDEVDLFFPKPEEMNIPSGQLNSYAPPLMNSSSPTADTNLTKDETPIVGGGMPPRGENEKMEVTPGRERALSPDLLLFPLPTPPWMRNRDQTMNSPTELMDECDSTPLESRVSPPLSPPRDLALPKRL